MNAAARCFNKGAAAALVLLLSANVLCASSGPTPRFDSLNTEVGNLIYKARYTDAHSYIRKHLKDDARSEEDQFYLDFFLGDVYRASGREHLALKQYEKAAGLLDIFAENRFFEALLTLRRAECHFNREQYNDACTYAATVTEDRLREALQPEFRAVARLILGYCNFEEERFDAALREYRIAADHYSAVGLRCEMPLALIKIAGVYLHTGRTDEMNAELDRAEALVDSCEIPMYRVLLYRAKIHISEVLGNYREAFLMMKELGEVNAAFEFEQQQNQIEILEARIKDAEMETLDQIKAKNAAVLREKELTLNIALVFILLLAVLSFFLIRVNRQRLKASKAISEMNVALEAKVKDRTENLREANQRISVNAEKLKEKNVQLLDFCNIISHNFRGPLGNMVALVDLFEAAETAEEREAFAKHFKPVILGLNETCNELFESLQVVQDPSVTSEPVGFEDTFNKTCRSLQAMITGAKAKISADFSSAPEAYCPAVYLESIFHNLISNAVKYRAPHRAPVITIRSATERDEVVLSVKDNGVGLDLERHGDALFKMRKVFHDHPEAKGFGLFLTKAQVESIGGRIWAESEPNEGSTFLIAFPKR